jgi:hypothetical protein
MRNMNRRHLWIVGLAGTALSIVGCARDVDTDASTVSSSSSLESTPPLESVPTESLVAELVRRGEGCAPRWRVIMHVNDDCAGEPVASVSETTQCFRLDSSPRVRSVKVDGVCYSSPNPNFGPSFVCNALQAGQCWGAFCP